MGKVWRYSIRGFSLKNSQKKWKQKGRICESVSLFFLRIFLFFLSSFCFLILQLWRYFPNNRFGGYSKIVESWKYRAIFFRFTNVINWSSDVEIGKNWGNFIVVYLLLENGVIYGLFLKKQRNVVDVLAR